MCLPVLRGMCHGLYVGCGLCVMVGYMIYVCLSMHVSMVGGEGEGVR